MAPNLPTETAALPTAVDFAFALGRLTGGQMWDSRDISRLVAECGPTWLQSVRLEITINTSRQEALRIVRLALKRAPRKRSRIDYKGVVELWQSKKTIVEIASALGIKVDTAGARVRRARLLFGVELVPHRETGAIIGMNRRDSALDKIRAAGNVVRVAVSEIGTRQSLHQAARTRGWKIKARLDHQQKYWEVSAVEAAPLLAVCRRKPS